MCALFSSTHIADGMHFEPHFNIFHVKGKYLDPRFCERPNTNKFWRIDVNVYLFLKCLNQSVLLVNLYFWVFSIIYILSLTFYQQM